MSPPLASLRWPSRPALPAGATGWVSETIHTPQGEFAVAVADHDSVPFEVWVLGGQPPRGPDAIAQTLSTDTPSTDRGCVRQQLSALAHDFCQGFQKRMPTAGNQYHAPSNHATTDQRLWKP